MRIPRIYQDRPLTIGDCITLDSSASNHLCRVLRLRSGALLQLFNGDGYDYPATLQQCGREAVVTLTDSAQVVARDSPLQITLAQGISRGERMDWVIQKGVELGVTQIAPLITERTVVRLNSERWQKRQQHWQGVLIGACEQSGRARVPTLLAPQSLSAWLQQPVSAAALLLDPLASEGLPALPPSAEVTLLIGPEGGLSEGERALARAAGYRGLRLGPRILRTETAALAALAVLQAQWGDWR